MLPVMHPHSTPVGILYAQEEDGVLCALTQRDCGTTVQSCLTPFSRQLDDALAQYFRGDPRALEAIPVRLRGTPFEVRVWEALRRIPFGQVRTYGEIARDIGCPGGARAVGGACGRNAILLAVPCHRVIASGGRIGGFAYGTDCKRHLLQLENPENVFL